MPSEKVGVRLDGAMRVALSRYASESGMTVSSAIRVLLAQGLEADLKAPQASFRAAAFREGVSAGVGAFRKRLQEAVTLSISDLDV